MPVVPIATALIEAELERYLTGTSDDPPAARAGAEQHHVLPLFNDFIGCWALAASGQMVFFAWDAPDELDIVSELPVDVLGTHVALAVGSRRYPSLSGICPTRTISALPCTSCDGSGRIAGVPDNLICACGGLGWLPGSALGAA